jgi:transcriptional regulator with XRE-family HTH domain
MAGTPSPQASALGVELRKARTASGLTQQQVADKLGVTRPTVTRYEDGTRFPDPETVAQICEFLGLDDELAADLMERARAGDRGPWLTITIHEQQRQLNELLAREHEAVAITSVTPLLIPGLLQTSDYARAIMITADVPEHQIETRVAVRMGRKEALTRRRPAKLLALINESVLWQSIGGPEVMAAQLRYLLEVSEWPTVDLRVVPKDSGWHPGLEGPFTLVEFADGSAIVHIETRASGLFLVEPEHVAPYQAATKRVLQEAMSPAESAKLITREAKRIEEKNRDDDRK